jgi:multidrug efflux pump subunit AcrA (membrane-fusion protein)
MHAQPWSKRPHRARSGRGRRRRWAVGGVVVAVAVAVAGVLTTGGGSGSSYRTASVEKADVDATLDTQGTIQPINQANLSFPVSGSVRSVSAVLGQHVSVGQTLAQLDTTSLDAQLASAQSTVATAQARLAADQASQTVTAAVAPTAFSVEITTRSPEPTPGAQELLGQQQARLLADQHQADQSIAREKKDLSSENSLCQAFFSSEVTSAPLPSSRRSTSTAATSRQETTPSTPDPSKCESAIATVLADQAAVDHDQQAVATDLPALNAGIDKLITTARAVSQLQPSQTPQLSQTPQSSQRPLPSQPQPSRTPRPTPMATPRPQARATAASAPGSTNRTAPVPRPPSAEQLTSDQAALDAAQAQLTEAQQAHDQAELCSPIDGTIGSVTISTGQMVAGNSSTPQIVVIGPGSHQVTTSVSDINVSSVKVGDAATVLPSGSSAPITGQVVSIGLLASSSSAASAGSISYPVTIGLNSTDQQLFAGQSASVSIRLGHATGTLTVPSSAVHRQGSNNVVSVLRSGTPRNVLVTLGTAGPTRTQVLTGLNPGDQVILADLSRSLPMTDVQNIRRIAGGGGGRPGG